MRYGIREFLLVMSVLVGGLAVGSNSGAADDPQPASSGTVASAAATDPAVTPEADQPAKADDAAASPTTDEPATDKPAPPEAGEPQPDAGDAGAGDEAGEPQSGKEAADDHPGGEDHPGEAVHPPGESPAASGTEHTGANSDDAAHHEPGEDHGDGHSDPHDLTHQNATAKIEDASEVKSDLAIWTLVVFLCLLALLGKFAWGPITEGLDRREASIAAAIDEAEQAAAKGAEQLKLYEAKLAAAAEETREILAQARKDAEATGERIVAEAQEAAGRERDKAVADIAAAKNLALSELTERSVDLAVSMAGRMIQRQLTPDDRASLIREALEQLPHQN